MKQEHVFTTIKIWKETLHRFKLAAAMSQESLVALLDRLSRAELAEQEQKRQRNEEKY